MNFCLLLGLGCCLGFKSLMWGEVYIYTLEEIEILKAASSKHLLNDVITGQNDPIYKLLPTSVFEPKTTAQTKQQTKIQKFKT